MLPPAPGLVVDDNALAPGLGELLRDRAAGDVERPAGRKRNDELDGPARVRGAGACALAGVATTETSSAQPAAATNDPAKAVKVRRRVMAGGADLRTAGFRVG